MSLFHSNSLIGASGQGGGGGSYLIERSLRFNTDNSSYLNRTPGTAGNRKTWTWSGWIKRSSDSTYQMVFSSAQSNNVNEMYLYWVGDGLRLFQNDGSSVTTVSVAATGTFRDYSAWYHVVIQFDSTQATASDRVKIYINGVDRTDTATGTYPTLNYDSSMNATYSHRIGTRIAGIQFFGGYMADIHIIDGQALPASSFGAFDSNGIWQPIAYTGSYGTNGAHLDFANNASMASLGLDAAGSNDWTVNNFYVGDGNGKHMPGVTSTGTIYAGRQTDIVDGVLSSEARVYGGNITFTPTSTITVNSSLRVYAAKDGTNNATISANGTSVTINVNTLSWYTISLPSYPVTLTSVIGTSSGGSSDWGLIWSAIEVDGVVLADYGAYGRLNDSVKDSPTNGTEVDTGIGGEVTANYPTLNVLATLKSPSLTAGNTRLINTVNDGAATATFAFPTTGKWYFEMTMGDVTNIYLAYTGLQSKENFPGGSLANTPGTLLYPRSGTMCIYDNTGTATCFSLASVDYDVYGIAYDATTGVVDFYRNGTLLSGYSVTVTTGIPYWPFLSAGNSDITAFINFGQRKFAYPAPSGYKCLCSVNLPAPTIADGSTVMAAETYTGNGSTQTISGLGFSPDLVWIKQRSTIRNNYLFDIIRGTNASLISNNTTPEDTSQTNTVTGFTSNGWTMGGSDRTNAASGTYVGWAWDAGSSTVTNNNGSISSQVRANPSAGFSIVTYTGNGTTATVGHGLNAAPYLILFKGRDNDDFWPVYSVPAGVANQLNLTSTQAATSGTNKWNSTAATSTVFTVINDGAVNGNTLRYVAYCFAPVAGYSSFGSYTGNGSDNGPFIYTGFRPAFVIAKSISTTGGWSTVDNARDPINSAFNNILFPNTSDAENSGANKYYDFISNGFKIRGTSSAINTNSVTYFYIAFAESPFQIARAR